MRVVLWFLLASIPLSASTISMSAQCVFLPTTYGPDSASCGDTYETASATVQGFNVAASAWAAASTPNLPGYASNATVWFTEDLVFTFFGGTGEGFAQPDLALSIVEQIGSAGGATASLGGCLVQYPGYNCPWDSFQFDFGVPETLTLSLYASATTFGEPYEAAGASGEAAYNGFLGFYDVNGIPLSGVTYEIGPVGQSSPEPGTFLLTAMAGAALLACALRRASNANLPVRRVLNGASGRSGQEPHLPMRRTLPPTTHSAKMTSCYDLFE